MRYCKDIINNILKYISYHKRVCFRIVSKDFSGLYAGELSDNISNSLFNKFIDTIFKNVQTLNIVTKNSKLRDDYLYELQNVQKLNIDVSVCDIQCIVINNFKKLKKLKISGTPKNRIEFKNMHSESVKKINLKEFYGELNESDIIGLFKSFEKLENICLPREFSSWQRYIADSVVTNSVNIITVFNYLFQIIENHFTHLRIRKTDNANSLKNKNNSKKTIKLISVLCSEITPETLISETKFLVARKQFCCLPNMLNLKYLTTLKIRAYNHAKNIDIQQIENLVKLKKLGLSTTYYFSHTLSLEKLNDLESVSTCRLTEIKSGSVTSKKIKKFKINCWDGDDPGFIDFKNLKKIKLGFSANFKEKIFKMLPRTMECIDISQMHDSYFDGSRESSRKKIIECQINLQELRCKISTLSLFDSTKLKKIKTVTIV